MEGFARLNLIGKSPSFLAVLALISKFAMSDATVLIQGETGTGKELAARAIHYLGRRRNLPFIPINCGALPDNLVESELFGHVRGAFTDAKQAQIGLVGQAKGGTLFLDEVEAMSPRAQVALLRFLQEKEYRPLGGPLIKDANVRVVVSSNADLKTMTQNGLFRSDLLFRVNVLSLRMPPLRERGADVALLATAILDSLNLQSCEPPKRLHPASISLLEAHSWPGNVRELENLIQREFVLAPDQLIRISNVDADAAAADDPQAWASTSDEAFKTAKARAVAQFEKAYVAALLSRTEGNISLASRLSGKDRSDLSKLIRKYGLDRRQFISSSQRP